MKYKRLLVLSLLATLTLFLTVPNANASTTVYSYNNFPLPSYDTYINFDSSQTTSPYNMYYGILSGGENNTICNSIADNTFHVGILVSGKKTTVTNCVSTHNGEAGIAAFETNPTEPNLNVFVSNIVGNNGWTEVYESVTYGGFRIYNNSYTTLVGNIAYNNSLYGIHLDLSNYTSVSDNLLFGSPTALKADNSNYNEIKNNQLLGTIAGYAETSCIANNLKFNSGFITNNIGSSSGTGAEQTIAHGLAGTPTNVILSNGDAISNPYQSSAADATNIYVTADNGETWYWSAIYEP